MRPAACSSSCIRRMAVASIAPGGSRCASASAANSISSCRRRRPKTASCSRSRRRTASNLPKSRATCIRTSAREILVQALLAAPMFTTRWRWTAGVALALPRFRGGKKVPPQIARMNAEDLLASVFPEQVGCAENQPGEIPVPDHPLVRQTLRDCLEEAMDIAGFESLLRALEAGTVRVVARDLTEPSPMALGSVDRAPLCLSRRCSARGASHPGRHEPALAGSGRGCRPRQTRSRGDRARA